VLEELDDLGIEVFNMNAASAIRCFQFIRFDELPEE
jgi:hypothetical protein